jgi:membrane associated rhomboid family serine protease
MDTPNKLDTNTEPRRLRTAFILALSFVLFLWVVKIVELLGGLDFAHFGIYPRSLSGLAGVLTAPTIHGSVAHLFANTPPIVVIGTTLLYGYPRAARVLLPALYLGGGFAVWLFAREAYHVGASGLAFGMLFFVFMIGVLRWEQRAIALSLVVFFLYGGMIWGVLPESREVSFESHLSGAMIGIALAFVLRYRDPMPPPKQYSWEGEEDEGEEDEEDADDHDWPDRL